MRDAGFDVEKVIVYVMCTVSVLNISFIRMVMLCEVIYCFMS